MYPQTYACDLDQLLYAYKFHRDFFNSLDLPGCYILTNLANGLCYVGKSQEMASRVRRHCFPAGCRDVTSDILKGHSFHVDLIFYNDVLWDSLSAMESYFIKLYDSYDKGYNRTKGDWQ